MIFSNIWCYKYLHQYSTWFGDEDGKNMVRWGEKHNGFTCWKGVYYWISQNHSRPKWNDFHFNSRYYIKKLGTAMGTNVAPTYVTLVLENLEETLLPKMPIFSNYLRKNWRRFLDDCFSIWNNQISIEDNNILRRDEWSMNVQKCTTRKVYFICFGYFGFKVGT